MAPPDLTRHVSALWPALDELFAAGDDVGLLGESRGWQHVRAVLDAEIDAVNATMERGTGVLDQAEYAVRHGRIGGLKAAQGAVDAIAQVAANRRQQQEQRHEGSAEPEPER